MALNGLGLIALEEEDHDRAEAFFEESLRFCEGEYDSIPPVANLGFAAFARNDFTRARELFERSIAVGRAYQDEYEMTTDTAMLATIAAFAADEGAAASLLHEAVQLSRKLDSRSLLATRCLPALAALQSLRGEIEQSVELIAAYEAQREETGLPPSRMSRDYKRRILEAAAGKISESEIKAALERGALTDARNRIRRCPCAAGDRDTGPLDTRAALFASPRDRKPLPEPENRREEPAVNSDRRTPSWRGVINTPTVATACPRPTGS
jgi:hypothetical protein